MKWNIHRFRENTVYHPIVEKESQEISRNNVQAGIIKRASEAASAARLIVSEAEVGVLARGISQYLRMFLLSVCVGRNHCRLFSLVGLFCFAFR